MSDWADTKLDGNTPYTDVWTEIRGRQKDALTQLNNGSYSNLPTNAIRWDGTLKKWQIWNGTAFADLTDKFAIDVDKLDGRDAGNASGNVAVNNGTKCTNLNADKLDGYDAGNASGNVAVNNGTKCTNLNADKIDGYDAGTLPGNVPINNGIKCTSLNADKVDGYDAGNAGGQVPVSNGALCVNLYSQKAKTYEARGCHVSFNGVKNFPNGQTDLIWDEEIRDTDGIHDLAINPERMTVPPGYTLARINAYILAGQTPAGTILRLFVKKNNSTNFSGYTEDSVVSVNNFAGDFLKISTPKLIVAAADHFIVTADQDSGSNKSLNGICWAEMELFK